MDLAGSKYVKAILARAIGIVARRKTAQLKVAPSDRFSMPWGERPFRQDLAAYGYEPITEQELRRH